MRVVHQSMEVLCWWKPKLLQKRGKTGKMKIHETREMCCSPARLQYFGTSTCYHPLAWYNNSKLSFLLICCAMLRNNVHKNVDKAGNIDCPNNEYACF